MKVYSIETEQFKLDGGAMFGVVPKVIWQKLNPADENNLCLWSMRCLLIEEGNRKILIDTGMGNKQSEKFFSHYYPSYNNTLLGSLKAHGFQPADITDIILTHLHFDHCGGAVSIINGEYTPTFPNATYWTSEAHWKWATDPNSREKASFLKENILPLQVSGQLQFVEEKPGMRTRFSENIEILFAYGHTKSMMIPFITMENGQSLVYTADLIPSSMHIPLPYIAAYDLFPMISLEEKESFLNECVENNYVLFFEHDPLTCCCRVIKTEKGYRAGQAIQLHETGIN
jgi:glyoxylase-like metal-dependent hydrolase (beta-lactamase superfamily II)